MAKIIGYIVTCKNLGEPLELCYPRHSGDSIPDAGVLLRNDTTLFKSRRLANAAIKRTAKWAAKCTNTADNWRDVDNFVIWRVKKVIE